MYERERERHIRERARETYTNVYERERERHIRERARETYTFA